ncbi:MAG TPA: linear amide C-N hydrolase, partial [Opitutaceae bacterium]|nr:linear amide C-N hydrolase [Opitutaceae bacterium]
MSWLPSVRAADQSAPSDIRFASRRCPRRHRWAVAGLAIILATPARPCTTLFLRNAENRIVGNNYDYYAVDGRVIVNRRGLRKAVYSTNSGLQWVSRFGSVTFNQWGHEFPNGGLNEAGLVVEQMMLDGTQYPIDGRPSITEMQWIQYQLDCSATVQDVVASDAGIRIHQDSTPLHFFVADAAGNAAVIEFLGGRLVAHTGDSLPIPALTNHTYEASLAYASITRPEQADHVSSLGRFVQAATSAATFAQSPVTDPVGFALAALDNVNQPNWTRWSTVCDIGRRRVYFRTQAARAIKQIALADLDFRPEATTRMLDINTTAPGVVVPDWPISRADNLAVLTSVFRQTTPLASTPLSYLQQRAAYPDSIVIEPRPPAITSHPASQTVAPGGHAVLSVTANGDAPPFAYQWSRNGIAITGATAPLLSLTSVTSADAADYAVTVTSAVGSTTSRFARLVVA